MKASWYLVNPLANQNECNPPASISSHDAIVTTQQVRPLVQRGLVEMHLSRADIASTANCPRAPPVSGSAAISGHLIQVSSVSTGHS